MTRVVLACALAVAAACGTSKPVAVDFSETPRNYLAKDYKDVYDRWTRHENVVAYTGTIIEVWATMKAWEFREAYVERYAAVYNLSEDEKAELRKAQLEASRELYEFHLTVQMNESTWNDLDKRSSPWRLSLLDGAGDVLAPESVESPNLPDAYEVSFFPRKTPFTRTYVVRFARGKVAEGAGASFQGWQSGRLTLRIASPAGQAQVTWVAR